MQINQERHEVSGSVPVQDIVRFGKDFELDLRSYQLRQGGRVLKLERIPMEILLLLAEQKAQIVSREQIVEKVWGKDVFLDTDNSINGAIRKIRQVLKDDSEEPRFIQTITGKGYRFIAPVHEAEASAPLSRAIADVHSPAASAATAAPLRSRSPSRSRAWVYAALSIFILSGVTAWFAWSRTRPQPSRAAKIMLAVLPFENLTGDADQDYFSDGLTEEMISHLGNVDPQHLGVIARTSVMHYKNTSTPLDQIGRELGIQYALEGSVRRDANNVRVTAELIQTKDQTHLWAREYDRELKDFLALQDEIGQEIADEIQLTLEDHKPAGATPQAALSPQDLEAYDLYLKGQYFLSQRNLAGFEQAIRYFEQAIAKKPNYARAYAGLADAYALMPGYSLRPQAESIAKARAAALKALDIDEALPEAHAALALIVQNYDWDWQTSEKEFRRAIELNPNYATAHHWYAEHLMWRGRFAEALQESERARQLDPLSLIIAADNGAILYFSRQYDRAIEKWRSVLEMNRSPSRAHLIRAAYIEKGMLAEALADTQVDGPQRNAPWYWTYVATIQWRAGNKKQAQHALHELLQLKRHQVIDPKIIADAYLGTGDKEQALVWLKKAYQEHSHELVSLKVGPAYDPLRGDPRFQELLRQIGLAD